jgi:hypothetical protein
MVRETSGASLRYLGPLFVLGVASGLTDGPARRPFLGNRRAALAGADQHEAVRPCAPMHASRRDIPPPDALLSFPVFASNRARVLRCGAEPHYLLSIEPVSIAVEAAARLMHPGKAYALSRDL